MKTIERVFGPATYTTNPKEQAAIQPEIFKRASDVIQKTVNEAKKAKDDKEKEKVIAKAKEEAAKEKKIFEDSVKFIKSVMGTIGKGQGGCNQRRQRANKRENTKICIFIYKNCRERLENNRKAIWSCYVYTTDPKKPAEITPELFKKVSELIRKLRKQEG